MPFGVIIQRAFLVVALIMSLGADARGQSLQKLLESAKGGGSSQKSQPSATEQKAWASEKLTELKAKADAFDAQAFRADLRRNSLPDERAEEFLNALQERIQNYEAAVGALTVVIKEESPDPKQRSPAEIPVPKDDAEADALRDKLTARRTELQTAATQVKLDEESLTRSQSALKAASQALRRAQEEFDSAKADQQRQRAALQLKLVEAQQEAVAAGAFFTSWRLYADELELHKGQANVRAMEKALSASGLDSIFNEGRARNAIHRIEENKVAVQEQVESAQKARQELDQTISQLEAKSTSTATGAEGSSVGAQLEIAREAREFANRIATAGQAWVGGLDEAVRIWKSTLAVAENPGPGAYLEARKSAEQLLTQGDPWREQIRRYLESAQARLEELEALPKSKDPATSKLEQLRLDLVRQRANQIREVSTFFEGMLSQAEQMRAESNQLLKLTSVTERFTQGFAALGDRLENMWNYELFTTQEKIVADNGAVVARTRGISVGKIVLGILGLAVGLFIAKTLAHLVRNNLARRFAVETARAAFLEKVVFYFLLVLVVLTTLNWLRIPLTAFAFLGGAIAIGVGFGAQTLMNNFISGLILLAEQRIKVGDLIDVDGHLGRVINLGTRCSRIRKFDGVDVLVPNSYLLEKNVINWTLSDSQHRYDFLVGVAYGTPTDLVMETLIKAIEAQPEALKEPAPAVAFEAFGDNALTFHVYYWLDIGRSDAMKVGTQIRLRIDRLCREAGIEMAFPQRDIHLHTSQPISVRVETSEKETT